MINSLSIKEGHRGNLIKVDDIDILSLSQGTDDIFIRYIDVNKFCDNKYHTIIEFYSIDIDGDKFIYSPLFSNEPITYNEFKSSVAHLILSGIIKKLAGVSITSKGNGFVTLSNGALIGIGDTKFIRDNHNRFYYDKECKSLLDLVLAFDFYISYVRHFRKSNIAEDVKVFFDDCLDKIDSVYCGVRVDWADTVLKDGKMEWAFEVQFNGFIKRFKFNVEQLGDKLIAKNTSGLYVDAYEALVGFIKILTDYIEERKKLANVYSEKFIAILDVVKCFVGDRNIKDVQLDYDAENKDYSCLLLLDKYKVNVYCSGGFKIYIDFIVGDDVITETISKNLSKDKIKRRASLIVKSALDSVRELIAS